MTHTLVSSSPPEMCLALMKLLVMKYQLLCLILQSTTAIITKRPGVMCTLHEQIWVRMCKSSNLAQKSFCFQVIPN